MKRLGLGVALLVWTWLVHTLVMRSGCGFWFGLALQTLLIAGGVDAAYLVLADYAGRHI